MADTELDRLLRKGIAAARAGDRAGARELLLRVIERDESVAAAWLWLSGVVDDPEERQICLENVLTLEPDYAAARAGLRYLAEQGLLKQGGGLPPSTPAAAPPQSTIAPEVEESVAPAAPRPERTAVELDPFGCPYCGGSVSGGEPRCDECRRPVAVRSRKRTAAVSLAWLVFAFVLLAVTLWGEGYLVAQLVEIGRLPEWLSQTAVRFLVGGALFSSEGLPGELVRFAGVFVLVNDLLAVLCLAAALGLALRFRAVYFGSFLLAGVMVVGVGAGLLAQLVGWVPALLRLGLVALAVKWLVDCAPAFEWETRYYTADVDHDLHNDLDYYNRGLRYREMGMWAKAAAHWKVASQLESGKVQYRVALANAYVKLGYPAAARIEAERALAQRPDDGDLRAFYDSLCDLADHHKWEENP